MIEYRSVQLPTSEVRLGTSVLIETEPVGVIADNLLSPTVIPAEVISLTEEALYLLPSADPGGIREREYCRFYIIVDDSVLFFDQPTASVLFSPPKLIVRVPEMVGRYNRRRHFRVQFAQQIYVTMGSQVHAFEALNLSGGGIAMKIPPKIQIEKLDRYVIDLPLPTGHLHLPAALAWRNEDRVGLRFTHVSSQQEDAIVSFTFEAVRSQRRHQRESDRVALGRVGPVSGM